MVAQLLVSVTSIFDTKPFYFHPAEWFGLGIFSTLPIWASFSPDGLPVVYSYMVAWDIQHPKPWQNAIKMKQRMKLSWALLPIASMLVAGDWNIFDFSHHIIS